MVDVRVFQMLGFFVARDFLTRDDCGRIRGEMRHSRAEPAGVVHDGRMVLDLEHRSTKRVGVGDASVRLIEERLASVHKSLERHFGVPLQGWQEPQFLRYASGGFFRLHADTNDLDGSPEFLRQRKVSAIIFLGHPSDEGGTVVDRGGDLVFRGLIDDPRIRNRGFSFSHDEGTFLAFPSTVSHEVTTVTSGQRYTVATWFF
jgi:predicted 2-oxoglutarate/Fe(II)-dependent dioxygenase YbiX